MINYSPISFIYISKLKGKERKESIQSMMNVTDYTFNKYYSKIEMILDFIGNLDRRIHLRRNFFPGYNFLDEVFHTVIFFDFYSCILLFLKSQRYQMNIILRHLIETFLSIIYSDIMSGFNGNFYSVYFIEDWQSSRSIFKLFWDSKN